MADFTNRATLLYNGKRIDSNIVRGEIVEVLSGDKNALDRQYFPGDIISYSISLVNSGDTDYDDIIVTDNLGKIAVGEGTHGPLEYVPGSIVYFLDGEIQTAPTVSAGPPLVIRDISVPGKGNTILFYKARVTEYAQPVRGATITNTAIISGGGLTDGITLTDSITAKNEPILSIVKSLNPESVIENGPIEYTFVIENRGNTGFTTGVTIEDIFDPAINITSVKLNTTTWVRDVDYIYDETTGEFKTNPGKITLNAATFTESQTGEWIVNPATATLRIEGTI